MIRKPCCSRFSLHKFVHLKYFWTQFKNVHLQGPCSLRPCISRPYCIQHVVYVIKNRPVSPKMFTNERLFTIQAFTITRVHCIASLLSSTCALTSFFFELSHVIYLKLTRELQECLLTQASIFE